MTYPFQNPDLPLEERVNGINLNCIARIHQMCLFPGSITRLFWKYKTSNHSYGYER
ncbi:hypothetical protein PAGL106935_12920 [Paenibacillus glucanolyticus]